MPKHLRGVADGPTVAILYHLEHVLAEREKRYAERAEHDKEARHIAFEGQKDLVNAAFSAASQAVLKVEVMNETRFKDLIARQDAVSNRIERIESRNVGVVAGWQLAIGAVLAVLAVIAALRF